MNIDNFFAWKCIISGVFHRSKFWHLRRKSAFIFSKWLFFQNSLGEKIKPIFELFIKQSIEFKFVLFLIDQTLEPKKKYLFLCSYIFWSEVFQETPEMILSIWKLSEHDLFSQLLQFLPLNLCGILCRIGGRLKISQFNDIST